MKKKKIAVVLVHEIYGVNKHMKYVQERLFQQRIHVVCPNLLNKEHPYDYSEETAAYQHFMQNIGFNYGIQQIHQIIFDLKERYQKVGVVGFSVGATIAWLCNKNEICDFVIGCYGSQIRNYIDIEPVCPTLLIFPTEEKAFNIHTLVETLVEKENKNLQLKIFPGIHGFIDSFSPNYHELSAIQALQCIDEFLQSNSSFS
ncbi:dienelactone hydrolase family protein [Metabacillus fastidiosus]|uniref:dienelactone hydrolase family protein n=1 Tax=Metabacillus fastidiosus TaxID=1458 RepID=UPI003D288EF9